MKTNHSCRLSKYEKRSILKTIVFLNDGDLGKRKMIVLEDHRFFIKIVFLTKNDRVCKPQFFNNNIFLQTIVSFFVFSSSFSERKDPFSKKWKRS